MKRISEFFWNKRAAIMLKNFLFQHRVKIGYFIGGGNILSGLLNVLVGNVVLGLFWISMGAFIIFDIRTYP